MVKVILGSVLGAVVLFVWGFAAWMVLPIHGPTIHQIPNETAVIDLLREQELKPGYYIIPSMPEETAEQTQAEKEAATEKWMAEHKKGPIASIIMAEGNDPMAPQVMITGFLINLVACLIVACLIRCATCCDTWMKRVGFTLGMGVFATIVGDVNLWNWMFYPVDYTIAWVVDNVVSWTLAGMVLGAIVKPKEDAVNIS